jgi:histone H3/H4
MGKDNWGFNQETNEFYYFSGADDLSLPKATVSKIISEVLMDESVAFSRDSRDLLIECCVEFITLLSSEANEIAEKDAKKTIALEHVRSALGVLEFGDYIPEIERVAQEHKAFQQVRYRNYTSLSTSC